MKISVTSPFVFKYLALPNGLGGRGGVQRFFMLTHKIPFEEKLIPYNEEWAAEKERMVSSGENPCGTVPVTFAQKKGDDSKTIPLVQHIATSRLLAKLYDVTSGDVYQDYVQDLVADEYQGFRDVWVQVSFAGSEDDKKKYRETDLPAQLTKFETLYKQFKTHDVYLSVSAKTKLPLWGDSAIFGLVRDHVLVGHITLEEVQTKYPTLYAMYKAYEAIPEVHAWIESKK